MSFSKKLIFIMSEPLPDTIKLNAIEWYFTSYNKAGFYGYTTTYIEIEIQPHILESYNLFDFDSVVTHHINQAKRSTIALLKRYYTSVKPKSYFENDALYYKWLCDNMKLMPKKVINSRGHSYTWGKHFDMLLYSNDEDLRTAISKLI